MNPFAKLLAISRRKSPWIYTVNSGSCNGCDIEIGPCISPRYDGEQIGMLRQGSPKHADILVVTGTMTRRSHRAVLDIYAQMPSPKAVVAIGSCPAWRASVINVSIGTVLLAAPTVRGVDAHLAHLLRPALLGDVIEDQVPELEVIVDGIEFELAILKADSPRPLLARGVESIEVGLSECH